VPRAGALSLFHSLFEQGGSVSADKGHVGRY